MRPTRKRQASVYSIVKWLIESIVETKEEGQFAWLFGLLEVFKVFMIDYLVQLVFLGLRGGWWVWWQRADMRCMYVYVKRHQNTRKGEII